jgi:transposase
VILREVVNGLMYVLSTGCQWRAIPKDLPPKSSVYDYFDLLAVPSSRIWKRCQMPARAPGSSRRADGAYGLRT